MDADNSVGEVTPLPHIASDIPKWQTIAWHIWIGLVICVNITYCLCTLHFGHNWGGDFSAYIMQAQSIVEFNAGEFIDKNRVTVEESSSRMGPVAYPWGFPLMLVPVYALCGLNLFAFKIVGLLNFSAFLAVLWYGFRHFHTPVWRSAVVLLFACNPYLIGFLNNILSDIPFLFISTLAICLIGKVLVASSVIFDPIKDRVLLGVVVAAAFFVRTNGILLIGVLCWVHLALVIVTLWRARHDEGGWRAPIKNFVSKDEEDPYKILRPLLPYVSFFVVVLLWKIVLPQGGSSHMAHLERVNADSLKGNALYYRDLLAHFYNGLPNYDKTKGTMIAYVASLPFVLIGMIRHFKIAHHIIIYIILTLMMFIIWPHRQGLRFLFPILPFYVMLFISGLSLFTLGKRWWLKVPTTLLCLLPIFFVLYHFSVRSAQQASKQLESREVIRGGPFADVSLEMFEAVKEHTNDADTIVFFKPRVLRLMTGRNTLRINNTNDMFVAQYICFLNKRQPFHIRHMQSIVAAQRAELVFQNKSYVLYKLKSTN